MSTAERTGPSRPAICREFAIRASAEGVRANATLSGAPLLARLLEQLVSRYFSREASLLQRQWSCIHRAPS